ncbi:hypothetical protein Dimus_003589 [Dionaea muscipula]
MVIMPSKLEVEAGGGRRQKQRRLAVRAAVVVWYCRRPRWLGGGGEAVSSFLAYLAADDGVVWWFSLGRADPSRRRSVSVKFLDGRCVVSVGDGVKVAGLWWRLGSSSVVSSVDEGWAAVMWQVLSSVVLDAVDRRAS